MKLKLVVISLLSALTLTAMAQEKKTLLINEPQGGTPVLHNMLLSEMTKAALGSTEYQLIERPDPFKALVQGDTMTLSNITTADLILISQIQDFYGTMMISLRIVDVQSAATIKIIEKMLEPSSDLNVLRQQCSAIAKKIFGLGE